MKPFHAGFTAFAIAISSFLPLPVRAQDALVDVVATGYGATVRDAERNAFRAAVEAVVGTSVDATTLVENDELIEDEILTYSAGMIEKASRIGEPKKTEDGFYSVKIKATVKKGRILEKLQGISAVNVALDGESLFARMASAQNNLADGEAMIRSVFARHAACIVAEAVPGEDGQSPLDFDPKTGEVFANVRVRVDMAQYARFVQEVLDKLGPMATRKMRVRCRDKEFDDEYNANGRFYFEVPLQHTLAIVENFRTGAATVFQFDRNFMDCISRSLKTGSIAFEVVLKAKDGTEMAMKVIPTDRRFTGDDTWDSFLVSVFAGGIQCGNNRGGFGLIAPVFGAKGDVGTSGEKIRIRIGNPGKTMQTFKVPLGRFQTEELQYFGNLGIKVGHLKGEIFEECLR